MAKENLIVVLISVLILSSIFQFGQVFSNKIFLFEAVVALIVLTSLWIFKLPIKIYLIFIAFIPSLLSSLISSLIENNIINFFSISFYFLGIIGCLILGANLKWVGLRRIIKVYMVFNILLHALGVAFPNANAIYYPGYTGIFGNPNVNGLLASFSIFFILLFLIANKIKFNFFYYIFFLVNFIVLILSVSRASLINLFMGVTLYFLILGFRNFSLKISKQSAIFLILAALLLMVSYSTGAFNGFIEKNSSLESDVTSGRSELWTKAIDSLRFSGYGSSYYQQGDSATHNNYLNIGVVFGGGVMVALITAWVFLIFYLLFSYLKYRSNNILLTFCILLYSLIYWMFEVGSSFLFVWVLFVMMGYSCFNIKMPRNQIC